MASVRMEGEAVLRAAPACKLAAPEDSLLAPPPTRDVQTLTEVCCGGELPEVEIVSLLEEQIPRYKLRADSLTQFGGYENQDWFIPSPALDLENVDLKLSPDQIRETLNYFVLCSNRVSQMTKTYNDIDAVTRLLEEKEKDLELTARIGQELLQNNNKLQSHVSSLEGELKAANEKITQLTHELYKKSELIQVLTNDIEESTEGSPAGGRSINLDLMQKKISSLEEENKALRVEYQRLASDANDCEEQEQKLVRDIALQLSTANMDMNAITEELERHKEENRLLSEQIAVLTAKLAETEMRLHNLTAENEDVSGMLVITRENQNSLATELADFKERYAEVVNLLRDTQEQLRKQKKSRLPVVRGTSLFSSLHSNTSVNNADSLQSELESSMYSEFSVDSGIGTDKMAPYKKVFNTVRCASRGSYSSSDSNSSIGGYVKTSPISQDLTMTTMTTTMSSMGQPLVSSFAGSNAGHRRYSSSIYSNSSLGYPGADSEHSDTESLRTDSETYPSAPQVGIPGIPGAADLEAALRRLTPAEISSRRSALQHGLGLGYESDPYLAYGCRTPDSIMSTGSSGLSGYGYGSGGIVNSCWKLPEKLQIVKPLEGSQTLGQWSQLATPSLSGLLDDRPGVKIRGGRDLEEIGIETYALSDLEEDEEYSNPGKQFNSSSCVYTYTTSTVMHPDDGTMLVQSTRGSRVASICPSVDNSVPNTPLCHSRRNSTCTFSTAFGIAKMLNERGIQAGVGASSTCSSSGVSTPSGDLGFSATATPCNSPDGTPPPSRSSSPPPGFMGPLRLPGIISSGASLLRRTFGVEEQQPQPPSPKRKKNKSVALSRKERKMLTTIKIVEKLEHIGLENIMATTAYSVSPLAIQSGIYTAHSLKSPMAQLTSLKTSISPSTSQAVITEETQRKSGSPRSSSPDKMGVPVKPGTGALNKRIEQLSTRQSRRQSMGVQRPDLGTVLGTVPKNGPKEEAPTASSALGTISSLLFGRKGGLL